MSSFCGKKCHLSSKKLLRRLTKKVKQAETETNPATKMPTLKKQSKQHFLKKKKEAVKIISNKMQGRKIGLPNLLPKQKSVEKAPSLDTI